MSLFSCFTFSCFTRRPRNDFAAIAHKTGVPEEYIKEAVTRCPTKRPIDPKRLEADLRAFQAWRRENKIA